MRDPAQSAETLLARLFTDESLRARFKLDPRAVAREFGLDDAEIAAFASADLVGLDLAADSYSHKRSRRPPRFVSR